MQATEILSRDQLKTIFGGSLGDDEWDAKASTVKEKDCQGKKLCDKCDYFDRAGNTIYGKCSSFLASPLWCSDLNCFN